MEGPRRWKFIRRILPAGCLLLGLGCVADQSILMESQDAATRADKAPRQMPHAQTCVAFAEFQARAATDPGRTALDKEQMQDQARKSYEQALKADPTYLPAYVGLGRLYQAMGDADRALAAYQRGLERLPGSPVLWYEQGVCQARQRQWPAAATSLQNAVAKDPENRSYIKTLAFSLGRAGRYDESLACFRKVTGEAQAHFDLARLLHHMHEDKRCRTELKLALAVQPDLSGASRLLAELAHPQPAPAAPVATSKPTPTSQAAPVAATKAMPKAASVLEQPDGDPVAQIGSH